MAENLVLEHRKPEAFEGNPRLKNAKSYSPKTMTIAFLFQQITLSFVEVWFKQTIFHKKPYDGANNKNYNTHCIFVSMYK